MMALVPMTNKEQDLTVKAVLSACKDITKLNKRAYDYLNLCCGFIAHYNKYGFMDYYSDISLVDDIKANASMNQWHNFREGERDYEYQMAKKSVYNRIVEAL
jgi:hypothetical protein